MFWTTRFPHHAWNPFVEFDRARSVANTMCAAETQTLESLPISLWRSLDVARLEALLPGLAPEDVQLSVEGDVLTLEVSVAAANPAEQSQAVHRERVHGRFTRTIRLPFAVDAERVNAKLENGRLTVEIPRAEADKPRRITIQTT